MAETQIIRLATDSSSAGVDWLVVDETGARLGNVETASLQQAAAATGSRRVVVLVPATDVLLAQPELPAKSGAKLAQMVPFALEEQLGSEVEDIHFALGKRGDQAGTPVAAISHARMREWHGALAAAGITVAAMYADSDLIPVTPNGTTLLIDRARVYVRRPGQLPVVLDVQPLIESLRLALATGTDVRESVVIYVSDVEYEHERELLEGLRDAVESLQIKLLPDGPLPLLAALAQDTDAVNLLQGPYAAKSKLNVTFAPWRYAAVMAVVAVLLHVTMKGFEYRQLKHKETQLDSAIAQVFQQAVPGAPVPNPLEARKQVEARLATLRGAGPTGGLLTSLNALSMALTQTPDSRVEALSFRGNVMDLRLLAPSVDALDRIQHQVSQQGITAQMQSATQRDAKFEGRFQLKFAGA